MALCMVSVCLTLFSKYHNFNATARNENMMIVMFVGSLFRQMNTQDFSRDGDLF